LINIEIWWCCLNNRERSAIQLLLPYFAFAGSYIDRAVFDAYWFALGYAPNNAMVVWFIAIYGLIPGTVPISEEEVKDVLFFDIGYWSQVYAFSLTDPFICTEPCEILTYPN